MDPSFWHDTDKFGDCESGYLASSDDEDMYSGSGGDDEDTDADKKIERGKKKW